MITDISWDDLLVYLEGVDDLLSNNEINSACVELGKIMGKIKLIIEIHEEQDDE